MLLKNVKQHCNCVLPGITVLLTQLKRPFKMVLSSAVFMCTHCPASGFLHAGLLSIKQNTLGMVRYKDWTKMRPCPEKDLQKSWRTISQGYFKTTRTSIYRNDSLSQIWTLTMK